MSMKCAIKCNDDFKIDKVKCEDFSDEINSEYRTLFSSLSDMHDRVQNDEAIEGTKGKNIRIVDILPEEGEHSKKSNVCQYTNTTPFFINSTSSDLNSKVATLKYTKRNVSVIFVVETSQQSLI